MLATGCRNTQSVSTSSVQSSSDSTRTKSETTKDSTSVKETTEIKTIPGSQADARITPGMLDSLIRSMRSMPKGVDRTFYLTDPKLQTRLSILMDSIGNVILRCSDKDETYAQTTRELTRIIEHQKAELERYRKESITTMEKNTTTEKGFFRSIWDGAKWIVILLVICLLGSLFFWIKSKLS